MKTKQAPQKHAQFRLWVFLFLLYPTLALTGGSTRAAEAVPVTKFLDSLGVNSAISGRGESLLRTIDCTKYLGIRWFRAGIEGDVSLADFAALHEQTGARFSWGLGSGGTDIAKLVRTGRQIAASGALLAFEGPNEPNNWGFTYQGQEGGRGLTWLPVAHLQHDLYTSVKSDPVLKAYPVWSITENGAETDNVGLQFLTIPPGAASLMPDGTQYADYANVHNYVYHPNSPGLGDNKTWNASDPSSACKVDGLFGEYGVTWGRHYQGYSEADLRTLPRVTTETGCNIEGPVTEEIQGLNLVSLYLDQFTRGWSYTAVYLLRDRVDEAGNQQFGFYKPDYTPRKAAVYLHNLTTILADTAPKMGAAAKPGKLSYAITSQPATMHDLLLQKRSGTLEMVVWNERVTGADTVTVDLGRSYPRVNLYDPIVGTQPVQTLLKVKALTLTLSNHPQIVELPSR